MAEPNLEWLEEVLVDLVWQLTDYKLEELIKNIKHSKIGEAKQTIATKLANQVREARIDELRLIEQAQQDEDKWSLFCMDDTSDFGNYIAGRIKELGE